MANAEIISFRKDVLPNTVDVVQERIKGNATIEEIRVRFYQGQQLSFKINPFIERKGNARENLVTYPKTTDPYLSGDNDYFVFPMSRAVENDEFVKVWAKNTDVDNTYTIVVDVVVDYQNGKERGTK